MTSPKDRRVTLALKWHYLDNLDVEEIQERFEREGYGSYANSTIRGYLNEQPKEEVIDQIEQEQADVRLQIAEREERMYQRAREAETQSTKEESVKRVVPQTREARERKVVPAWEFVEDDAERPEWATERDVIIRFVDGEREVLEDEEYPVQALDGSPKYTTEFVGLERDVPDQKAQAMARQEQSSHLEQKGEALGVYTDHIELDGSIETESTVGLDEETKEISREILRERYNQEGDDDN